MIERGGITLSQEQANIVDHVMTTGPVAPTVVSAGAGSGKTRVMIATDLHLIKSREDVRVDDFALITFTNKATDEMRKRLEEELDNRIKEAESQAEADMWFEQKERLANAFIGTIHRFCSMLLRQYGYEEHVPHETEILIAKRYFQQSLKDALNEGLTDPDTQLLFNEANIPWEPFRWEKYLTNLYEHIRNNGRSIDHVAKRTYAQPVDGESGYRNAVAKMLQKIDRNYKRVKQEHGGQDSHDLLYKCAQLIEKHQARIGRTIQKRYKFLFVDEFQDTDRTQKRIIKILLPYMEHVLVVGDRKQAIYGWRGADYSVLEELANEYNMNPIPLLASRRPTRHLFEVQRVLFAGMRRRYSFLQEQLTVPEDAHVPQDQITPLEYLHVMGNDREAYIMRTIDKVRSYLSQQIHRPKEGSRSVNYKDICILFRTNRHMAQYEVLFKEAGIPVVTDVGGGFFQKPEILYCYYMLHAILSYPNDTTLSQIMGTPFFPIKAPITIHRTDFSSTQFSTWLKQEPSVERWYKGMMEVRQDIKVDLVPQLLTKIYEFTGVREWYAQQGDLQAIANLEKLVAWSRTMFDNAEALTMQSFFQRFQNAIFTGEKMDEADLGEMAGRPNAVVFSTVHSSKGLEYPIVIIPEVQRPLLNDFQLPSFFDIARPDCDWGLDLNLSNEHGRSLRFNEWMEQYRRDFFQEEARVFYVAVTRAQHAVCFIGGGNPRLAPIHSNKWSWKDEILSESSSLQALGDEFVRIQLP
ncbi:UvrD-helicase domain-containing protein [Ectobacillus funiculus]|uniref:UvrD-helicase domain-containing protein n=1 Tax=Ectobacillus funiculus TaxID=137993 RepID=UPI00101DF804|nr:ATP-dependent helicase [Ectobacillus funiculus]